MFSWGSSSSGGSDKNKSYSRFVHIESYVNHPIIGKSTRRVYKDLDTTFDTVFMTTQGTTLILRVHLGSNNYSNGIKAPTMMLVGVRCCAHTWIDMSSNKIKGYPSIRSDSAWSSSGMKLGDAVSEVIRHLQLDPPEVIEFTDPGLQNLQKKLQQNQQQQQHIQESGAAPPTYDDSVNQSIDFDFEIPTNFPILSEMSKEEMDHLLTSEEGFNDYAKISPQVTNFVEFRNDIINGNADLATSNLRKKEELESLFTEVKDLREQLMEAKQKEETLTKTKNLMCGPTSHEETIRIQKKLIRAKKKIYTESDDMALEWIDSDNEEIGARDIDQFVNNFMQKRMLYHERAAKVEVLNSLR